MRYVEIESVLNFLNGNPTKWSNTLKQFVGTAYKWLVLKGLSNLIWGSLVTDCVCELAAVTYKKRSFPIGISSVNVTKSEKLMELMENIIFCAVAKPSGSWNIKFLTL